MVPDALRRKIEAFALKTLSARCRIEREVQAQDAYGDVAHREWELVADAVPCRLISASRATGSAVQQAGSQETMPEEHRLIVPRTVELGADMRVLLAGAEYRVVRATAGWTDEVFRSAIVTRRYGEG